MGEHFFRGTAFYMQRLYLEYSHAFLLLSGARMQRLFGPNYLFYGGSACPPHAARPYLQDVHVASIAQAPPGFRLEEGMRLLRACS